MVNRQVLLLSVDHSPNREIYGMDMGELGSFRACASL